MFSIVCDGLHVFYSDPVDELLHCLYPTNTRLCTSCGLRLISEDMVSNFVFSIVGLMLYIYLFSAFV
jgi:hypothetical protein